MGRWTWIAAAAALAATSGASPAPVQEAPDRGYPTWVTMGGTGAGAGDHLFVLQQRPATGEVREAWGAILGPDPPDPWATNLAVYRIDPQGGVELVRMRNITFDLLTPGEWSPERGQPTLTVEEVVRLLRR